MNAKSSTAYWWSFLDTFVRRTGQFVISIVLARLLFPEDFGLIAMLTIFITLGGRVVESGLGSALIQREQLFREDKSTVFVFVLVSGAAMTSLLFIAAPAIADFYQQPELLSVARSLAFIFVVQAFGSVPYALLQRELRFRNLAIVHASSIAIGGITGIYLAVTGFGVWSLVAKRLMEAVCKSLGSYLVYSWVPSLLFSIDSFRRLFSFGSKMFLSMLINYGFAGLYPTLVGRVYGVIDLGFLNRADLLASTPAQATGQVVSRVAFPLFSSAQRDVTTLSRELRQAMRSTMLLHFPMMIGLAVTAEPIVFTLLTEKWMPCVPYVQILAFGGLWLPLHQLNLNLLAGLGRSDLFLRLEVLKAGLTITNLSLLATTGVIYLLIGQTLCLLISLLVTIYIVGRFVDYGFTSQLRDIFLYLSLACVMGVLVWLVGNEMTWHSMVEKLVAQIAIGLLVFFALVLCLPKTLNPIKQWVSKRSGR